jgi:RNA polymerase sigma factor (sigma-70 family)
MELDELKAELEELHTASFRWALSCCRWNSQEAEDVLQNTYLKVLQGKARFDGKSTLKTWLFSVIRRTAAQQQRHTLLRSALLLRFFSEQRRDPPVGDGRLTPLKEALASLTARQRQVLELVFYQGMTIEQAAAILDVSLGTARTHYERGKKLLRQKLQGVRQ